MARLAAFAAAATMLSLGMARPAFAAEPNSAEEAFQRGRTLLAEGRYADACKAFETSQQEDPASGTLLALAYCQELSGLLASAWANYRAAAELAQHEGHAERREAATHQSQALADRVSVLTIVVPPSLADKPSLRVTLDGTQIARTTFGNPIPVDGGTYRVEAVAGDASWSATVSIDGEKDKETVVIELSLPRHPVEPRDATPVPAARPKRQSVRETVGRNESRTVEHAGLATAIAGLATVGVGLGFGVVAHSKHRASLRNGHCDETGCDAKGMELENDAFGAARVSTWCVVGGSVLAVGGVVLYFGSKSRSPASNARLETNVTLAGARLLYTESF
jgi:hypothetical protein